MTDPQLSENPQGNDRHDRTSAQQTQQHRTYITSDTLILVPLIFMIIHIMSALLTFALYTGV